MVKAMTIHSTRRQFIRSMGLGAAALPFVCNLSSFANSPTPARKQRLIVVFSPNGVIQPTFWPEEEGSEFTLGESVSPFEPFKDQTLFLRGISNRIRGDGDGHMRGIGCLLTGIELFPGNIQGGSDTPAGWAKGQSIDQEVRAHLQANEATRTRFGSLEFGVMVPDRADTWTRMVYAGANKPISPIDDPYQMFAKLYGQMKDRESLVSILDDVQEDLRRLSKIISAQDRQLLEEHTTLVRQMESQLKEAEAIDMGHAVPELEPGVTQDNENMPRITKMQIDLLVNSMIADFTRVGTLQFTNSVGQARMKWLGIEEDHHGLSHEPDSNDDANNKLTKINKWYCEQIAYLAKRLRDTPEPGGNGNMLDNTLIVWTNELGKGNSHTHDDIPFVFLGGGADFKMGRSLKFKRVPHNRLLMSIAHGFGHHIDTFGNPDFCGDGPLTGLT